MLDKGQKQSSTLSCDSSYFISELLANFGSVHCSVYKALSKFFIISKNFEYQNFSSEIFQFLQCSEKSVYCIGMFLNYTFRDWISRRTLISCSEQTDYD